MKGSWKFNQWGIMIQNTGLILWFIWYFICCILRLYVKTNLYFWMIMQWWQKNAEIVDKGISLIKLQLPWRIQPDLVISIWHCLKGSFSTTIPVLSHLAFAVFLVLWIVALVTTSRAGCSLVTGELCFSLIC